MARLLPLLAAAGPAAAQTSNVTCLARAVCERELEGVVNDIRDSVVDRAQAEVLYLVEVAPTALMQTDVNFNESLVDLDLSTPRNRTLVAEKFYYQMKNMPELYWVYYGEQASGRFLGFRRATAQEVADVAGVTAASLIRTECAGTGSPIEFFKTSNDDSSGGDPVGVAFRSEPYNLTQRAWFLQGLQIATQPDLLSHRNHEFTPVYDFADGSLGLSAVRKVEENGTALGVLGADYALPDLGLFLSQITMPTLPNSTELSPLFIIDVGTFGPVETVIASNNASITVPASANLSVSSRVHPDPYISGAAAALFAAEAAFLSSRDTARWAVLSQVVTSFTFTVNGTSLAGAALAIEFPLGGLKPLRWIVVTVTGNEMDFEVEAASTCAPGVSKLDCRETLLSAASELRFRSLRFLAWLVGEYLGVAFVVVNSLDESYNLGMFNAGWCDAGLCGKIDVRNSTERSKLATHMRNMLGIFPEVYWIYMGQEAGGQYLGYLRENGTLLWECSQGAAGGCNTSHFVDAAGRVVLTDATQHPHTRSWYTDTASLKYDELAWTDPYLFGNGKIGVSLAKKAFGGDFRTIGHLGAWAADFTLQFIADFLLTLDVIQDTVLYVMTRNGTLVATNAGERAGEQAARARSSLIRESSVEVANMGAIGMWHSTRPTSTIVTDSTGAAYFVDVLRVTDNSSSVRNSYDWALVAIVPEASLYDIDFLQGVAVAPPTVEDDDDLGSAALGVLIAVIAVLALCLCGALWMLHKGRKDKSEAPWPAAHPKPEARDADCNTTGAFPPLPEQEKRSAPAPRESPPVGVSPRTDEEDTGGRVTFEAPPGGGGEVKIISPARPGNNAEACSPSGGSVVSKEEVHAWLNEIADLKSELRGISTRLMHPPADPPPPQPLHHYRGGAGAPQISPPEWAAAAAYPRELPVASAVAAARRQTHADRHSAPPGSARALSPHRYHPSRAPL